MNRKVTIGIFLVTALLLSVPLVAQQFTQEVNWSVMDFVVMGTLLCGSGLMVQFVASQSRNAAYKLGVLMAVGNGLFLIWINLAVGLIGSENNPANLMYSTVILIGLVGGISAGFKPLGMSYALFATAGAQFLVPFIAMMIWHPPVDDGLYKIIVLNTNIAIFFAGSAILFRRASHAQNRT